MSNQSEYDSQELARAIALLEEAKFIIDTMLDREGLISVGPSIRKRLNEATDSTSNAVVVLNWTLDEIEEES